MKRKTILIYVCFMVSFFMTGCFNYRDINLALFATAFVVDIDESDNIVIYTESFKPYRGTMQGSETGVRILSKGTGKTLFEAIRNMNLSSSYKHNFTQNKAVIFSEKAAKKGIDKIIDFIDRDQEILIRSHVFVYRGDISNLMNLKLKDEEYIGIYLFSLINNIKSSSRAVLMNVNKFMSLRLMKSKTAVVTMLEINKDALEDKLAINGGAVIQNDKMVEHLARNESQGYNFLMNQVKTGTLEVTNPYNPGGYVTLEILHSKTKTRVKYEEGKVKLIKNINVRTSVAESQYGIILDSKTIGILEANSEANIKKYSSKIFNQYKMKNIDIFCVADELYRYYPKLNIKDPIKDTELYISVDVDVEGSSNKTNKD